MARIRLSPLLSHISGSIGAATFSKHRGSYVLRSKPRRQVSLLSDSQSYIKSINQYTIRKWQNLSESQRNEFAVWAALLAKRCSGFSSRKLSAYELYTTYWRLRFLAGYDDSGSVDFYVPSIPTIDPVVSSDGTDLFFTTGAEDIEESYLFLVRLSMPVPVTQYPRYSLCRRVYCDESVSDPYYITSSYQSHFASIPAVGARVLCTIIPLSRSGYVYYRQTYHSLTVQEAT